MQKLYIGALTLLASMLLSLSSQAQADWRPFRPGLIYSYSTASSPTFLLRLDSAYTTAAGDSAWAFNRLLRPLDNTALGGLFAYAVCRKSRNNLFGARLRRETASGDFLLENVAEGSYQTGLVLRLRPQVATGSTWMASTSPAITATLSSRVWQPVSPAPGSPSDSVATITLSSGQVLRLSRRYGLLEGPRWLGTNSNPPQYTVAELPATLANSPLYPPTLFNLHPGDRLGYSEMPQSVGGPPCTTTRTLRIIQSRQQTVDSLIITFREQSLIITSGYLGCGTPGTVTLPAHTGRLAFSLRTGQSPQFEALPLLSGEYKPLARPFTTNTIVVGTGLSQPLSGASCIGGRSLLSYQQMHGSGQAYGLITDGNWFQYFAPQTGLGDIRTHETLLDYAQTTGGTCGSSTSYAGLLPTKAEQAATIASVAPNPAVEAAVLTLRNPAQPGTRLQLRDALGRLLHTTELRAGQQSETISLNGRAAGLYFVQLISQNQPIISLRLTKE